jgi:hypothetical protein
MVLYSLLVYGIMWESPNYTEPLTATVKASDPAPFYLRPPFPLPQTGMPTQFQLGTNVGILHNTWHP